MTTPDHAALESFLRRRGFRPPEECAPGLHESYLPSYLDAELVAKGRTVLNGYHSTAWLPRKEPPHLGSGGGASWGRGSWYRPLSPYRLVQAELELYRISRDYLIGTEWGRRTKRFGPKIGRAMRWLRRGGGTRWLYVVPRVLYKAGSRDDEREPFPRTPPKKGCQ